MMAIYHLSAGFVSRSTGRSAVQSVAYITDSVLEESRREITADYRNRSADILFSITLAPKYAPDFAKNLNVWDVLETFEDRYAILRYKTEVTQDQYKTHAQTAQTVVVALPKELTPSLWKELVIEFATERFVARGLVVSLAIHNDEGNPHAHFQISRRSINEKGEWSWAKDRDITTKASLIETRKLWAEKINAYLEKEGFLERVDHRSFLDLGLPFEPTRHEGWFAHKLERMGVNSRIIEENKDIKQKNKERLAFEPEGILKELCSKQATFSAMDLARLVQTRLNDDAKLASVVYEASLQKAVLVGSSLDGQARYSSPDYVKKENEALQWVEAFNQQASSIAIESTLKEATLNSHYSYLNPEQREAVETLTRNTQLGVLIGRAGTGKTTTLKAIVDLHTQSGYQVIGLSLSAAAAENLKWEANCDSETIAFYLDKWERLEVAEQKFWSLHPSHEHALLATQLKNLMDYGLTKKHLIIVDEAGMVGTSQWHRLLYQVQKAGAKLLAVGDDNQFKAIEAGDFFRKFTESAKAHSHLCMLSSIMRQKEDWMKEVSHSLSQLKTYEALANYENHGLLQKVSAGIQGIQEVVKSYTEKLLTNPKQSGLLLASTNVQCDALNGEVRALLKEKGMLENKDISCGNRLFSTNDQILFLKNDREKNVKVYDATTKEKQNYLIKNGSRGRIITIEALNDTTKAHPAYQITVALDANTHAKFNTNDYSEITHAYATTLHKAQGQTVDWSYVLASKNMDAYATYVALTRHKLEAKLFYDEKTFVDFKDLQLSLGKISAKDLAIDYTINPESLNAWENVQEYKLLGQDLAATVKEKNWEGFQALKAERTALGKIILKEWDEHQHFIRQAGITQESLAIACGEKMRPLSLSEIEAKTHVSMYAEKSLQARLLWRDIRQTHPGKNCYKHERYQEFSALRQERNALAKVMVDYKSLYKEFVTDLGRTQGIGWKTLTSEAQQGNEEKIISKQNIFAKSADYSIRTAPVYVPRFEKVEPQQVKDDLQQKIGILAQSLLGDPQHKNAREWRYGNKGSISVCVAGIKQGLYADFEAGSYGGPLKLIQDRLNVDHKEAYKWAINWLGYSRTLSQHTDKVTPKLDIISNKQTISEKQWIPIYPIPSDKQNPDLQKDKNLSYQLTKNDRFEVERYAYKDAEGNLIGYTVRLENSQDEKVILPLMYCQDKKGNQQWRWQGFGSDRPLYGLDRLAEHPHKSVIVVEGERTANSAQALFRDRVVVSWPGGAGAVNQVDWSPLVGKNITLWPDNDAAGLKAMEKIESNLLKLHEAKDLNATIEKIVLPSDFPPKWDLADPLPKGRDIDSLLLMLPSSGAVQLEKFSINREKIIEILTPLGMKRLYNESPDKVMACINELYEDSLKLNAFMKVDLSDKERVSIEEKSIIAGALHSQIQKRFYDKEDYWTGAIKAKDVALIAADIKMGETSYVHNEAQLMTRAQRIFESNKEEFIQNFLVAFKGKESLDTIQILSQEQQHCYHQTQKIFNADETKQVIETIKKIQEQKGLVEAINLRDAEKLEIGAVIHEVLKKERLSENTPIQKILKSTVTRMVKEQNKVLEKSKEPSKTKDIALEQDKEILL